METGIVQVMGGRSAFGRPANRVDLASAVLEGLPAESYAALSKRLHLSRGESASVLGVSLRTLDRLTGESRRLSVTSSDRLARVPVSTSGRSRYWKVRPTPQPGCESRTITWMASRL